MFDAKSSDMSAVINASATRSSLGYLSRQCDHQGRNPNYREFLNRDVSPYYYSFYFLVHMLLLVFMRLAVYTCTKPILWMALQMSTWNISACNNNLD